MASSNGNISALLTLCEGNPRVTGGFSSQRPVTRSFEVFSDLRLNKRLSKQSRRRWIETPSRPLWRHCYVKSRIFFNSTKWFSGSYGRHSSNQIEKANHDDVIKWKYFLRYWLFVRGIHLSPVNYPHKGQWRGTFMFSLICVWINTWVSNREAGDSRRHSAHCDIIAMVLNEGDSHGEFKYMRHHTNSRH